RGRGAGAGQPEPARDPRHLRAPVDAGRRPHLGDGRLRRPRRAHRTDLDLARVLQLGPPRSALGTGPRAPRPTQVDTVTELEAALAEFLPPQPWFAGQGRGAAEARQLTARPPDAGMYETKGPTGGPYYHAARDERLGGVYLDLLSRAATVEELRFSRMPGWTETRG